MTDTVRIPANKMKDVFSSILLKCGFEKERAEACAEIFTANSIDGVYTHGVNRFFLFVKLVTKGFVFPNNDPTVVHTTNALEQWNGNLAPGVLNAVKATDKAMQLAKNNGIGCVALSNTNHWMRGGYYGWHAAKNNFVFIGWTNTIANMPAWGATDAKLGNNPLVIAVPFNGEAIVMDMAMSQFSYGSMELAKLKGEQLSVDGGFDKNGKATKDPSAILESKRVMPAGYWKGGGLSLLLDILSVILSGGWSVKEITENKPEHGLSQVFIAIDLQQLKNYNSIKACVNNVIIDYKQSVAESDRKIVYPGERVLLDREKNLRDGIPVVKKVWDEIETLL
ncbi:MAG TPA: 3-dehydro-L-gulonate 2-dehydrogenase [Flavisolibacter sp.]|jgi:3-dehydro-L-gulonate 2-dehydrogenase|nr:3-dehydro-L-gulonate 2-dehydrogenase [Flavisolibacter sp.]